MMDFSASQHQKPQGHSKNAWAQAEGAMTSEKSNVSLRKPRAKRLVPSKKTVIWLTGGVLLTIIATIFIRAMYHHITYAGIDTKRYQAVYLTNDDVYFGKVHMLVNGDTLLTDVFRVQATTSTTNDQSSSATKATASDDSSGIRLIKPGKELHAPDDTMLIKKDSILFVENLKTDGKVTQAIIDYHRQGASN